MKEITCSKCNEIQYSMMDKKYVGMFGNCWTCDKKKWMNKELSTEEYERREQIALYGGK